MELAHKVFHGGGGKYDYGVGGKWRLIKLFLVFGKWSEGFSTLGMLDFRVMIKLAGYT